MREVYILQCSDNTLYTGITNNLEERIKKHNEGKWAKYTSGRTPVKVLYSNKMENRSEASKEERRIKRLTRKEKIELIENKKN